MKYTSRSMKTFARAGTAALFCALLAAPVYAQEEFSVEQLRRELREAADSRGGEGGFALSDKDIEAESARLEAEEAELLKKLSSPEAQALVNDVASGKIEPSPTAASLRAHTDGSAPSTDLKAIPAAAEAVEAPTLVRSVGEATQLPAAPKASLSVQSSSPVLTDKTFTSEAASASQVEKVTKAAKPETDSQSATIRSLNAQLSSLRRTNSDLSSKLQRADAQVSDLTKQLEAAKNRLMLTETEVERLAGVIQSRNRSAAMRLSAPAGGAAAPAQAALAPALQRSQPRATEDTPVATVVTEKANLRTGPGTENSPLMSVGRGTRLVVETRQGEWYRVVTPTGTRAWISADVVAFGPSAGSSPTRTVKIRGFDNALKADATGAESLR